MVAHPKIDNGPGRSVLEWIGATPNAKVPEKVKLRIWRRQMDADGKVLCGISGQPIEPGDKKHLHHKLALCLKGEHRESNLTWVLAMFNMEESKREVAERAYGDARAKSHAGINDGKTALSGPDHATKKQIKEARSKARSGDRIGVPVRRVPPGFVSATEDA